MWVVITGRAVLHSSIIPEGDRPDLPLESTDVFGPVVTRKQLLDDAR
ncbi:uncharacterized protein METZ01_LOCUS382642 [marine metagenome]|uniref:Uncharacterized protein n=1 Tax=marine metagenome TaxID=408172 RepID=A0A382U7Y3_9ZZZZ